MNSPLQAPRMRAAARRVKAGGERFLGGVLPGATARRLQVRAFADDWAAANLDARQATGPLWVVLGDSASQGIGATTREASYVCLVHELLRRRAAWRVVNLSRAGAGVADVLARQLPELVALTAHEPAALVSCIIGAEDVVRRSPGLDTALRQVLAALPPGAVVGTLPQGTRGGASALNAVIREEAERHAMRIAVLPVRQPGPGRGRDPMVLGDVEHAAWARVVLSAIDGPAAEAASITDPQLQVVSDPQLQVVTDPRIPVVPPLPVAPEKEKGSVESTVPIEAAPPGSTPPPAPPTPAAPQPPAPVIDPPSAAGDAEQGESAGR